MPIAKLVDSTTRSQSMIDRIDAAVNELMVSLPDTEHLSREERRAFMARYAFVLEGNFVSWMSATFVSVKSEQARFITCENLREEIRDNHPGMLRRFCAAASCLPTQEDQLCVMNNLELVRRFVSKLDGVKLLAMMLFFEHFLSEFMPYLARTAKLQGSLEFEYTDVHGAADVEHSAKLRHALSREIENSEHVCDVEELMEGVRILSKLIRDVLYGRNSSSRCA